jgi:hypothetical protein
MGPAPATPPLLLLLLLLPPAVLTICRRSGESPAVLLGACIDRMRSSLAAE